MQDKISTDFIVSNGSVITAFNSAIKDRRLTEKSVSEKNPVSISFICGSEPIEPYLNKDDYVFYFLISGSCKISEKNKEVKLEKSDCLCALQNEIDIVYRSYDFFALEIKVQNKVLVNCARELGFITGDGFTSFSKSRLSEVELGQLKYLSDAILNFFSGNDLCIEKICYSKLIIYKIIKFCRNDLQFPFNNKHKNHRVLEIRNYILSCFPGEVTVDDIASQLKLSTRSIYNIITKEFGVNPTTYIRYLKIEMIHQEIYRDGCSRSITEIASEYGFTNLGRFSSQYRDYIGELPSETVRNAKSFQGGSHPSS